MSTAAWSRRHSVSAIEIVNVIGLTIWTTDLVIDDLTNGNRPLWDALGRVGGQWIWTVAIILALLAKIGAIATARPVTLQLSTIVTAAVWAGMGGAIWWHTGTLLEGAFFAFALAGLTAWRYSTITARPAVRR